MTKADKLAAALDVFLATSPDVEAAAIVSADGLPMASALPRDVQEDRLAAMGAALLTRGERAASGLGKGELAQVFVEGENGYVFLMAAGPDAVLVSITSKRAKVGLVLFEMRRATASITEVMSEGAPERADTDAPAPVEAYLPPEATFDPPAAAPEPAPVGESHTSANGW